MSKKKYIYILKKNQKYKTFQILSKNIYFFLNLKLKKIYIFSEKKYSLFLNIRNMRFDQSSPDQPNPERKKT